MIIDDEKSIEVGAFIAAHRSALERALVARFGMTDGLDAAAHAVEFSIAHWDRLWKMNNPVGYLFRVGNTYGLRAARLTRRVSELVTDPSTSDERADIDLEFPPFDGRGGCGLGCPGCLYHAHARASLSGDCGGRFS